MRHINDLLNFFGGTRATARALNVPPSTVNNWKHNGLPSKLELLDLIKEKLSEQKKKVSIEQLMRLSCEKS